MEYTYGSIQADVLQNIAGIIEPNGEILSSLPDIPNNATMEYGVQATNHKIITPTTTSDNLISVLCLSILERICLDEITTFNM